MFRGKAHINNALLSFLFHFHVKEKFLNQWKGEFTYFFLFSLFWKWYSDPASKGLCWRKPPPGQFFNNLKHLCTPSAVWQSLPWGGWRPKDTGCCLPAKHPHKCLPLGRSINICRLTDRSLQVSKNVALSCSQVHWRCPYNHWVGWRGSTTIHVAVSLDSRGI